MIQNDAEKPAAEFPMLSIPHLIVIFVVALIIFGPEKLPELARNLGRVMAEFRRATGDLRSNFEGHMRDLEREAQDRRIAGAAASSPSAPALPSNEPAVLPASGTIPTERPNASATAAAPQDAPASGTSSDLSSDAFPQPRPSEFDQNPEQVSSDGSDRPA